MCSSYCVREFCHTQPHPPIPHTTQIRPVPTSQPTLPSKPFPHRTHAPRTPRACSSAAFCGWRVPSRCIFSYSPCQFADAPALRCRSRGIFSHPLAFTHSHSHPSHLPSSNPSPIHSSSIQTSPSAEVGAEALRTTSIHTTYLLYLYHIPPPFTSPLFTPSPIAPQVTFAPKLGLGAPDDASTFRPRVLNHFYSSIV